MRSICVSAASASSRAESSPVRTSAACSTALRCIRSVVVFVVVICGSGPLSACRFDRPRDCSATGARRHRHRSVTLVRLLGDVAGVRTRRAAARAGRAPPGVAEPASRAGAAGMARAPSRDACPLDGCRTPMAQRPRRKRAGEPPLGAGGASRRDRTDRERGGAGHASEDRPRRAAGGVGRRS